MKDPKLCAYRIRIEQLLEEDDTIPRTLTECVECSGLDKLDICPDYKDLAHIIGFAELYLNKPVSFSQRWKNKIIFL